MWVWLGFADTGAVAAAIGGVEPAGGFVGVGGGGWR